MTATTGLTIAILLTIALFHALWGLGFSVPAGDRLELARMVIGQSRVPPPLACFVVALGLVGIAGAVVIVAGSVAAPAPIIAVARIICWLAVAVFAARAAGGYLPQFEQVFSLEPFHTLNRLVYSPLCAALAALLAVTARS